MSRDSSDHYTRDNPDRPKAGSAPKSLEGGPRASLLTLTLCALFRHRFALLENPSTRLREAANLYASFSSLTAPAQVRQCRRCGSYQINLLETGKEPLNPMNPKARRRLRRQVLVTFVLLVVIYALAGLLAAGCDKADSANADLQLTGRAHYPALLTWNPSSLNFGDLEIGDSVDFVAILTNTGDTPAAGTIALPADCPYFTIQSGGGTFLLNPDEAVSVLLRYAPGEAGVHTCNLRVTY